MKMRLWRMMRPNPVRLKRFRYPRSQVCYWCGCQLVYLSKRKKAEWQHYKIPMPPNMATREHLVPLGRGGPGGKANLVAACYECNHKRGADMTWTPHYK